MKHKGEILQQVVKAKAKSLTDLAKKLGYHRTTLYEHFADADLGDGIILKYAKALKYDFINEFPELSWYTNRLEEPLAEYSPLTLSDALKQIDYWRSKYIDLLERYNALLQAKLAE